MPLNYDAVLFDLDGTLWHFDDTPSPGGDRQRHRSPP